MCATVRWGGDCSLEEKKISVTGLLGSKESRVAQTGRGPVTKELTPYSQEPVDGTHLHKGHNL